MPLNRVPLFLPRSFFFLAELFFYSTIAFLVVEFAEVIRFSFHGMLFYNSKKILTPAKVSQKSKKQDDLLLPEVNDEHDLRYFSPYRCLCMFSNVEICSGVSTDLMAVL